MGFMSMLSPRGRKSSGEAKDSTVATVEALQTLQKTLHTLTPRQQSDVKKLLPFAASEWLDGLALSIRAQEETAMASVGDSSHSGKAAELRLRNEETADAARIRLTPDSGKVIIVLVGLPARGPALPVAEIMAIRLYEM